MSSVNGYSPRALERLEMQISQEATRASQEAFGDEPVLARGGSTLHGEINGFIDKLVSKFPAAENGSKFINSRCIVCPTLYVNFSHLKPLLKEQQPGSLFLDEVGLAIPVGVLDDPDLGSFTTADTLLKLKNIALTNAPLRPNEFAPEYRKEKPSGYNAVAINKDLVFGEIDENPNLMRTELRADIKFGELVRQKNVCIPVETQGDETTTELVISLPELSGKICHDGSVTLPNGAKFNISQFTGEDPVTWVNYLHRLVVPFGV